MVLPRDNRPFLLNWALRSGMDKLELVLSKAVMNHSIGPVFAEHFAMPKRSILASIDR